MSGRHHARIAPTRPMIPPQSAPARSFRDRACPATRRGYHAPAAACATRHGPCSHSVRRKTMKWLSLATVALLAVAGCSKQNETREPTAAQVQTGAEYEAGDDDSIFDDAWDAISDGAEQTVEAGEWTLDKAGDGAVVVWKTT